MPTVIRLHFFSKRFWFTKLSLNHNLHWLWSLSYPHIIEKYSLKLATVSLLWGLIQKNSYHKESVCSTSASHETWTVRKFCCSLKIKAPSFYATTDYAQIWSIINLIYQHIFRDKSTVLYQIELETAKSSTRANVWTAYLM